MSKLTDPITSNQERLETFMGRIYKTEDADVLLDMLSDLKYDAEQIGYEDEVIDSVTRTAHYKGITCAYNNLINIIEPILRPEKY